MELNTWAPWVLTIGSAIHPWLIGNRMRSGWLLHVVVSCGALSYYTATEQYGFLPTSMILIATAIRNYRKWGQEEKPPPE